MLEPPDVEIHELLERVRLRFAFDVDSAEFLAVGNDSDAWAFRLETASGPRFLKVLGRPVDAASVAVPRFLADHGVPEVVVPLALVDGGLFDRGDPFSLVLYPFVDARRAAEAGLSADLRRAAGSVLKRIHGARATGSLGLREESFSPPAVPMAERVRAHLAGEEPADDAEMAFAELWLSRDAEIERIVRRAEELGELARARSHELVICHADFHAWNVLVDDRGGLRVVDWDEVLLAPKERDLMFVDDSVGSLDREGIDFFRGYGEVDVDPLLTAYYRFDWVVQEVADYGKRVLFTPDLGEATRANAVEMFAAFFEHGDVVEAAHRSQADLEG